MWGGAASMNTAVEYVPGKRRREDEDEKRKEKRKERSDGSSEEQWSRPSTNSRL